MRKNRKREDERLNEVTRRYRDLLEMADPVSSITDWDYLIKTALDHRAAD